MKPKKYVKLLNKGAKKVITSWANVKPGERVLIITEDDLFHIASLLASAVAKKKAFINVTLIEPRNFDEEEPPKQLADEMLDYHVIISLLNKSITHTSAIRNATLNGARVIIMTQFNEEKLISCGTKADFNQINSQRPGDNIDFNKSE